MRPLGVFLASMAILVVSGCSSVEPLTEARSEWIDFESVDLPAGLWDPFMPPWSMVVP